MKIKIPTKTREALIIALLVLLIDQLTKWVIIWLLPQGDGVKLFPFLDVVHIYNYGISFGMLQSRGMLGVWVFSCLSIFLCIWLCYQIKYSKNRLERGSFSAIIGGALGNVIDRIVHGGVVDFISFHWKSNYFPAFNIADSMIVIGVGLILLVQLWHSYYNKNKSKPLKKSKGMPSQKI